MRPALAALAAAALLSSACGSKSAPAGPPSSGPDITSIDPASGTTAGGTQVVISGSGFSAPTVTFDTSAATVVSASATTITVTTPAHAAGPVTVTVTNGGGQHASRGSGFSYDPAPLPVATTRKGPGIFPQLSPGASPGSINPFPGWSNLWMLERDLSISDFNFQFNVAGQLFVGTPTTPGDLDGLLLDPALDQSLSVDPVKAESFADLTFTLPAGSAPLSAAPLSDLGLPGTMAALAGSQVTVAVTSGSTTTADGTRLQQVIDLTGVGPTAVLALSWSQLVSLSSQAAFDGSPPATWRVVLRDAAGNVVHDTGVDASTGPAEAVPLPSELAGTSVTLSFELTGPPDTYALVNEVSLTADDVEQVSNGDFSAGLTGWTSTAAASPRRVVGAPRLTGESGVPRPADGLRVTRSVYLEPGGAWARLLDLFENPTSSPVSTTAVYLYDLGAVNTGVIKAAAGDKAWSAWDAAGVEADVAVVHGAAQALFRSTSALDGSDGSEQAYTLFPLTVPAGKARAVVQFLVLGTVATNASGSALYTDRATAVEAVAQAIVDGWSTTPTYRANLSVAERAAVTNF